jgi:hypothetical protein
MKKSVTEDIKQEEKYNKIVKFWLFFDATK